MAMPLARSLAEPPKNGQGFGLPTFVAASQLFRSDFLYCISVY